MRNIYAIFRRELLAYFVSPVAYFVITGFVLLSGYFFFNLLAFYNVVLRYYSAMPAMAGGNMPNMNSMVVEGLFQTLLVVLVFLIPLLTMRVLAEEKRRGTFELLVTSPVSVSQIILGKFLAVGFVIVLMLLLSLAFPMLLVVFGEPGPEVLPILSGFLAVVLCALAFASIGMAVSSFTENQIVAGISTMVVLLLLYVIHAPARQQGGSLETVLNYLSPVMQAKDLFKGVVSLTAIVYFLSLTLLGIFFSYRALEAHRWR